MIEPQIHNENTGPLFLAASLIFNALTNINPSQILVWISIFTGILAAINYSILIYEKIKKRNNERI